MKKMFVLFALAILALAGVEDENMRLQQEVLQKDLLQRQHTPVLRGEGNIYAQLQPPAFAKQYDIKRYDEDATVYLWYQNGENFIRVEPKSTKFFTCSSSFAVVQNGMQHNLQLLQKEDGSSFCEYLYIPVTFKISSYSGSLFDKFDDTIPLNDIIFEGYDSGAKIYHISVGVSEGETASSSSSQSSCLSIITEQSDPNEIKSQILDKNFSINGYYIHYGNGDYEWIYIPASMQSIYKLEKGVDEKYHLRWLLINGVKATKNGDKITFTTP
ncbi:hypothetical protein [Nitratiruptor tergarcus]|uniref:Uncharacterized protein n=1 Tax=Nitratiruptor tergarcus DSM 16512 TaxID=1069081 RepID=A0A1W1WS79_9BACT|nr:hypothetical protein [Nitratiruptor tergarcus]SMC08890.1 hypothetical protein SAMN05660197_0672 [Nitratiruptor tergarcus DSM 16512]